MPEHLIAREHLHDAILELWRKDNEQVRHIDPIPDDLGRVLVITAPRGGETR